MSAQITFPMRGGLDEATPAIALRPGAVIACLNHEAQPSGYQRTQGYERFDGQPAPSEASLGHEPASAADLTDLDALAAARRALIGNVPGSGPVRGVLWFGDKLNAWRDSGGATACLAYYSSAGGWQQHDFGALAPFTSGGTYEVLAGDTITGATSGATATVRYIALYPTGDWGDGDATGIFVLDDLTGTFVAENLNVGANLDVATISDAPEVQAFPPGGRYEFEIYNFRASSELIRAYGANGVGLGFEFDGTSIIPISTGSPVDTPFMVKAHKAHLFFGFEHGSLQNSGLGEPLSFSALLGAAELGVGRNITNLIPNAQSTFFITTESSVFVLTGNDSSDFILEGVGDEDSGAKAWTAQRPGQIVYVDNRGVRSAASTQAYGNFRLGTYTSLLTKTLRAKQAAGIEPVASAVIKSKDQYLLFFADGTGISLFFGTKNPEPMTFEYPFVVSCTPHVVEIDGKERCFVGADDGYVYELNVGRSFDGEPIEAFIALPYGHQGNPQVIKRYHKTKLDLTCGYGTELGIVAQFSYAKGEQPNAEQLFHSVDPGGNPITAPDWPDFSFVAPQVSEVEAWLDGLGTNLGVIVVSRSALVESYTLEAATVLFTPRGVKR
jgi:hypothetical protein